MVFKTFLLISTTAVLIVFIACMLLLASKPSPVGVYHCVCDIPEYGVKEALVTVQIEGETWGAQILQPTEINLNIFNHSVPCSCRTV